MNSDDGFKPGLSADATAGVRYNLSETVVPQLQINIHVEKREQGVNADVANSGATLVYLSPGVAWSPTRRFSLFAFLQAPLYQRLNGLQLEATELVSLGLHYRF